MHKVPLNILKHMILTSDSSPTTENNMSSNGTILITGLNGYLGQVLAKTVLEIGHSVRGTVRNVQAGEDVKQALVQLGHNGNLIEVVQVADIAESGGFDKAVAGCCAIIHQASPTYDAMRLPPKEITRIAAAAVINIIDSAMIYAGPELRSIVLMSSTGAIMDYPFPPRLYTEKEWPVKHMELVENEDEFNKLHPADWKVFVSYSASKTSAERAFWGKRALLMRPGDHEEKLKVSFTAVQGSTFIGPAVLPWNNVESMPHTVNFITGLLMNQDPATLTPGPSGRPAPGSVDVRDVARVLLWSALHPDEANGQRILINGATGGPQAAADILDRWTKTGGARDEAGQSKLEIPPELRRFEVKNKGTPCKGYNPDYSLVTDGSILEFDGRRAVELTEQEYIPFEHSILDTVMAALPAIRKAKEA